MPAPRDLRTGFTFAPPQEDGAGWHISLEAFAAAARRSFAEPILLPGVSRLRGVDVLDFEFALTTEIVIVGHAMLTTPTYSSFVLLEASADEAALFAAWLRESLLPAPTGVNFMTSAAMEIGLETPWPVPPSDDAATIEAVIREHLDAVEDDDQAPAEAVKTMGDDSAIGSKTSERPPKTENPDDPAVVPWGDPESLCELMVQKMTPQHRVELTRLLIHANSSR